MPVVPMPRWIGMPQSVSCLAIRSEVRFSWKHSSGWAWMSRRSAAICAASARMDSMTCMGGSGGASQFTRGPVSSPRHGRKPGPGGRMSMGRGWEAVVGRPSGHDCGGWLAARANSPALLGAGACRRTRFVRFAHCAQTGCGKSEGRGALGALAPAPALLGASHAPGRPPDHGFRLHRDVPRKRSVGFFAQTRRSSKPGSGARRRACAAPSSAGRVAARAQHALRGLTCRSLFERSERSERSEFCGRPRARAAQGSQAAARPDRRGRTPTGARPRLCHPQSGAIPRTPSTRRHTRPCAIVSA